MTSKDQARCDEAAGWIADAADGTLPAAALASLLSHLAECPDCARLQGLAGKGKAWLQAVGDVEAPASLVHNILAATTFASRTAEARAGAARPAAPWAAAWAAAVSFVRQPRLVLTASMAFFSFSMLANVTGATLDDLQGLRPRAVSLRLSLRYHETAAGVTRYYENNRLLRDLQNGLQALRDVVSEPSPDVREESEIHG